MDRLVEELIEQLMQPYQLADAPAIGQPVGRHRRHAQGRHRSRSLLLRRSNLALQHARAGGIGNWSVFQPDMGQVADYRQWIESELHTAFVRGDFDLHYQPQLDLCEGKIIGYEALIRWRHPERGMIAPMEFIPIAEETGMILPIGEWVLRRACNDARHLPDDCFVAVNISPVQFMTKDFVGTVREVIESTGIKPERLELEVTETAMMQDRERAAVILKQLADMGISVAVDDFGTGYSNLSYLIDFSFQKLKIDRSFVSRIDTDSKLRRGRLDDRRPVARARRQHHRRGCRDREPGDAAQGGRLRGRAGLPVRPAGAARRSKAARRSTGGAGATTAPDVAARAALTTTRRYGVRRRGKTLNARHLRAISAWLESSASTPRREAGGWPP